MSRRYGLPIERLMSKFTVGDGCWEWTGHVNNVIPELAYGLFYAEGRTRVAHHVVWETLVGPLPDGLVFDHLCRNPRCVRPAHGEWVTFRENVLRGIGPTAVNAAKTHCPQGHEFTVANTRRYQDGRRECRICRNERSRQYRLRMKKEKVA